ncbi:50S ribosomal protein L32 [Anaerolineales bacterium]
MGALPKRRISRSRRDRRRAHDALTLKHLVVCQTCGEYHLAHHICKSCGGYNGKNIIEVSND